MFDISANEFKLSRKRYEGAGRARGNPVLSARLILPTDKTLISFSKRGVLHVRTRRRFSLEVSIFLSSCTASVNISVSEQLMEQPSTFYFLRQQSRGEKISVKNGSRGWAPSLDGHDKVGQQISSESDNLATDSILACCKVHIGFSDTLSQGYTVWDHRSIHHVHLLSVILITSMKSALCASGNSVEVIQTGLVYSSFTHHIADLPLFIPLICCTDMPPAMCHAAFALCNTAPYWL